MQSNDVSRLKPLTRQRLVAMRRAGRLAALGKEEYVLAIVFASRNTLAMAFSRKMLTSEGVNDLMAFDAALLFRLRNEQKVQEFFPFQENLIRRALAVKLPNAPIH